MYAVMLRRGRSHYNEYRMAVVAEEDRVNRGITTLTMDRLVDVAIATHRGRQKSMTSQHSGGICGSTSNDAWASQELASELVILCKKTDGFVFP